MQYEFCTLAYVSGSEKQKEDQTQEIREYCSRRLGIPSSDIQVLDSETLLQEKLREWVEWKKRGTQATNTSRECILVVTDLRVISRDPAALAHALHDVLIQRRIRIEVVKNEHRDWLENYQPGGLSGQLGFPRQRVEAGLEEVAQKACSCRP